MCLLALPAAASAGGVAGCVAWGGGGGSEFLDEAGANPLSFCEEAAAPERCAAEDGAASCGVGACLVADGACDVWWRRVTADVIPPIPELAAILPGGGPERGACRVGGVVGSLGIASRGALFGACALADGRVLDGGGFDILQARPPTDDGVGDDGRDQAACGDRPALAARFRDLVDEYIGHREVLLLAAAVGAEPADLRSCEDAFEKYASACELAEFLSPSRLFGHVLNGAGLHAMRALLAERIRDARLAAHAPRDAGSDAGAALDEFRDAGYVVRDFDAVGGDAGLYAILRAVAGEPDVPRPPYEWHRRDVASRGRRKGDFLRYLQFAECGAITRFTGEHSHVEGPGGEMLSGVER